MSGRPELTRRAALLAGGAAAAELLSGCTTGSKPRPAPPTGTSASSSPSPSAGPTAADWSALAAGLDGSLKRPGSAGFAAAHRLYDPRWDAVVPAAVVRVQGPDDVAEALRFAARFGLRVVPRGGGHSYLGASVVTGGLVIDLRSMRTVSYDAGSRSATIGGGAALIDVYRGLATHGRGVPGGTCPSVGWAGLAQGGGFGVFDRTFGLSCDSVVELDVVTAGGEPKVVDAQREPDLFWALRGGGGGDFAVVTSMRAKTFAAHDIGRWSARWAWSRAQSVVAGWQRFVAAAPDAVWANLHLDVLADGTRQVMVIGFSFAGRSPGLDRDALVRSVGADPVRTSSSVNSHLATVQALAGPVTRESFVAGSSVPMGWLSGAGAGRMVAATQDASAWPGERHAVCDPLGAAVARVPAAATAFPWRRSPFTVQWYAKLPLDHPPADIAAAVRWVAAARSRVRADMPGSYVNYPSPDVSDPATYHGGAYARLRSVKASVDPGGVLRPPSGVPG